MLDNRRTKILLLAIVAFIVLLIIRHIVRLVANGDQIIRHIVRLDANGDLTTKPTIITSAVANTAPPAARRDIVKSSAKTITLDNGYTINILDPNRVPSLDKVECIKLVTAKNNYICVSTGDKFIAPVIKNGHAWEGDIWTAMKKFLDQDPDFGLIDIGANIGVFTLSAAAIGHKVIAVEAFYENIQRLSESIRLGNFQDKVQIVHNAVSDVYEKVEFWAPEDNPGGTHTMSEGVTLTPEKKTFIGDHSKIGTIHLDDLVRVIPFQKAVMKVDIEGYETKAFLAVSKLLDTVDIRALFMEWSFITATDACMKIVEIMQTRNYSAHTVSMKPLSQGKTLADVQKWPQDIVWVKQK